jgi:hypothetical protein
MIRTSALCPILFCALTGIGMPQARAETDAARPALRLSLSSAAGNGTGSLLAAGRYGNEWGVRAGAWLRDAHVRGPAPDLLVGVDHLWARGRWRFGLGAAWLNNENDVNGTRWNFSIAVAYDFSDRAFIEFVHFSHGAYLGIRKDDPNGGWNFIGVGVVL